MFDFRIKILLTKHDLLVILSMTLAFCSLKACCSEGGSDFFFPPLKIAIAKMLIDGVQPSDVQGYRLNCSRSMPQALGCATRRKLCKYLKAASVDEKERTQGVV